MDDTEAPRRIFTYGTLAAAEVMEALVGHRPASRPAVLDGYARYTVRGRVYPGIVAEPDARTEGVLYEGLDTGSVALLDRFEGSLYERIRTQVRCDGAGDLAAEAYVVPEARRHLLAPEPWDLERFVERHLREWVRHCASLRRPAAEQFTARAGPPADGGDPDRDGR